MKYPFICPQWMKYEGSFDSSMYHIDHIKELRHGGKNDIKNLQALCPSCHSHKTNQNNLINYPRKTGSIISRNVSQKVKKQVAAQQLFRCANVSRIFLYKRVLMSGSFGGIIGAGSVFLYDYLNL